MKKIPEALNIQTSSKRKKLEGNRVQQGQAPITCYLGQENRVPYDIHKSIFSYCDIECRGSLSRVSKNLYEFVCRDKQEFLSMNSNAPNSIRPFKPILIPDFKTGNMELPIIFYIYALNNPNELTLRYKMYLDSYFEERVHRMQGLKLMKTDKGCFELTDKKGKNLSFHNEKEKMLVLFNFFKKTFSARCVYDELLNEGLISIYTDFIIKYRYNVYFINVINEIVSLVYIRFELCGSRPQLEEEWGGLDVFMWFAENNLINENQAEEIGKLVFGTMLKLEEFVDAGENGLWELSCFKLIIVFLEQNLIKIDIERAKLLKGYLFAIVKDEIIPEAVCGILILFFKYILPLDLIVLEEEEKSELKEHAILKPQSDEVYIDVLLYLYLKNSSLFSNTEESDLKSNIINRFQHSQGPNTQGDPVQWSKFILSLVDKSLVTFDIQNPGEQAILAALEATVLRSIKLFSIACL